MNKVETKPVLNKFAAQGRVKEVVGSVLNPMNAGLKMVLSVCSQSGNYETPFYNSLIKRWSKVKDDYRSWFVNQQDIKLGNVNSTFANSEIWIMQMVCLDKKNKLDKKALETCLAALCKTAKYENASLHASELLFREMPVLKKMLLEVVPTSGLVLYVYKEPAANV